MNNCIS